MAELTRAELHDMLAQAETRAADAEAETKAATAALERMNQWRKSTLTAVVAIALLAILMLGVVAFHAIDNGRGGSKAVPQRERPSTSQPARG